MLKRFPTLSWLLQALVTLVAALAAATVVYLSWPTENYGGMQNKGFGISVNTVNIVTKDFQWKTGINFSMDRNKVTKLVSPLLTQYYSSTNNSQAEFLTRRRAAA